MRAYYHDSQEEAQEQAMNEANTHADAIGPAGESLDQAHERLGHTAPRITLAEIEANIVDITIVKYVAKSGQVLRWAVITTQCGFAVTGEPSASVSPENDSAELGEKFAIENARKALWPLMGYALKEALFVQAVMRADER
jgi:hypothetical protein